MSESIKEKGLFNKYIVKHADGEESDPNAKYFVLRYDKNDEWGIACREALLHLCLQLKNDYPQFVADLEKEIAIVNAKIREEESEEPVILTPEEAEAMLPDGEYIHTFRQAGRALLGADWGRDELLKAFKKYPPELAGKQATAMQHGLVFRDDHGNVFVETKETENEIH